MLLPALRRYFCSPPGSGSIPPLWWMPMTRKSLSNTGEPEEPGSVLVRYCR